MSTGYKIYFFIKDALSYLVLGVVLLPLRFLLSGGCTVLCGSLGFIGAWLGGKARLSEGPPMGAYFVAFLKWLVVFAASVCFWVFAATGFNLNKVVSNEAVIESTVSAEKQAETK